MSITPVKGYRVLFLMAVEAEYGTHLRARFEPVLTGVGPVEGGVVTAATLAALQGADGLPDLVVSLGSAGSARLAHCGVYQASAIAYRDMDASALGFARGVTPFLDQPAEIPLAHQIPGIAQASLSTGGAVISGAIYDAIAQDMVDMESYAVLRACQLFGVPLIALRGISDGKAPLGGLHDWTEYLHIIDEGLAQAVDKLEQALDTGAVILRELH
ncbi:5'-methylthioadenosine/S-adenosylhomocysteine nucleosidase [Roseinatronobacter alkalisoli]|uniref:5'-methylthioadenosine/S-adenosylhomocysteine nucleosidase n=1 Tax=Roseinatronobacter alkalisoli TaxID=3028235 RepID=A0ABT5T968_9RHOB|nr:5'-methylthioadenosine/S-adenosylhomocysteine nucleosidase [Roseinatronobacter sp. HJB301]MDD7971668.1 5'-methylthioadenosine/S-adenosylhomocysteine nucleosidase [Roseinatronobacter sp. HJB301]